MSLPTLEAAPGMPLHLVVKASTVELPSIAPTRRRAYLQPAGPHAFVLRCDDDTAVSIGQGRFTVVELRRGVAARIFTTAVTDYLDRGDALAEMERLSSRLEAAGFEPAGAMSRADVETFAEQHEQVRLAEHRAAFGSGSWRVETWLRTLVRTGSAAAELLGATSDHCLLNVVIHDDAVASRLEP